jgi:hypothetical protein
MVSKKKKYKEDKEMLSKKVVGYDREAVRVVVSEGKNMLEESGLHGKVRLGGFGYDSVLEMQVGIIWEYMEKVSIYKNELEEVLQKPAIMDWLLSLFDAGVLEQLKVGEIKDFMEYYMAVGRMKLVIEGLAESERYQKWLIRNGMEIDDDARFFITMLVQCIESVIGIIQGYEETTDGSYEYLLVTLLNNWK